LVDGGSKKKAVLVLWGISYNFCYGPLVFGGYFATEEKENHREIREKISKK
jgi:hypothetical protein